jgi:hypothetical protein
MLTAEDGISVLDDCCSLIIMFIIDFLIEVLNVRFCVFIVTDEIANKMYFITQFNYRLRHSFICLPARIALESIS